VNLVRATRHVIERRMSISDFDSVLDMLAGGGAPTYTGKLVSPRNALQVSAFWACMNVLADDFATLPFPTYRWRAGHEGEARDEARDHYLWPLFMEEANPYMSAYRFKRVQETWRHLWGNAYSLIDLNGRGQVTALWPIRPDRVKPIYYPGKDNLVGDGFDDMRGRIVYLYYPLDRRKDPIAIPSDRILHVRNTSLDGLVGLSTVEVHRQCLGTSMAMVEHQGRFYSNGAVIQGILTHPSKLGVKAQTSLEASMKQYAGLANSHKMMILEEGMQYQQIGMKLADAQYIESCNFQVAEIARICKVPGHRINSLDRATDNNIEKLGMEYVQYTLGPNAANWCAEVHFSLLSTRDRQAIFLQPDYTYILAADHASRATYIQSVTTAGAFGPDDVRHLEGRNPLPGGVGKMPRVNIATAPLGSEMASGVRPPPPPSKPTPKPNVPEPTDPKPVPTPTKPKKKKPKSEIGNGNGHASETSDMLALAMPVVPDVPALDDGDL
jgi:HK97 family phage portal protein